MDSDKHDMVERIKAEVSKNVKASREKFIQKLEKMRESHERNLKMKQTKIVELKSIEENVLNPVSSGDANKCLEYSKNNNQETTAQRIKFCDSKITNDKDLNLQCKEQKEFCGICCQHEFGAVFYKERESCYAKCELLTRRK